jgi:hypothetical protein
MKSFRLFREIEGHPDGLYRALVRVVHEATERAEAPLFVPLTAESGQTTLIPVDLRASSVAGIVNLKLKPHGAEAGDRFPLFQGTLECVEARGRGPAIRMRGTYLVPLARGRAQRSVQARKRAEEALEAFLETLMHEAERRVA